MTAGGGRPAILLAANYGARVGYAWNNIYRLFAAIMRESHARGLSICVSFRDLEGEVSQFDPDVPYRTLQHDWRDRSLSSLLQLRRHIRAHDIRYLYLTDQLPVRWDYALLRLWGVRRIIVHSRISVPDPAPAPRETGLRRLIKSALGRIPLLRADRTYAVSNFVRNRLLDVNCIAPARVVTILNGIEIERWLGADPPAGSTVVFFAAARAARYKGISVLIEAAALLRSKHGVEAFAVHYAGDGPDLQSFKESVSRAGLDGHFRFLGPLADTRSAVGDAHVIVVPSRYGDACPSTVSEALASGRPLIASRAGGIPELIGEERNALLVPPGDAAALAAAMMTLCRDPQLRRELGERGLQRARTALRQDHYHRQVLTTLWSDLEGDRFPS